MEKHACNLINMLLLVLINDCYATILQFLLNLEKTTACYICGIY